MSDTPLSDKALKLFPEFSKRVRDRMNEGRKIYGDTSFKKTNARLIEEIQQELLDVSGWSFVLYAKLEDLLERMYSPDEPR